MLTPDRTYDRRVNNILRFAQVIPHQQWTFAKTMPTIPHEYALRKTWDKALGVIFDEAVQTIRNYGYVKFWGNRPFTYLNINGWKYWTMGDPVHATTVINRAQVQYPQGMYDVVAAEYDAWFDDSNSHAENAETITRLRPSGRVLDIGCGTGALIREHPEAFCGVDYTGIDVSGAMVARARAALPDRVNQFHHVAFEDWWGQGYDLIYALFGSASYLNPDDVARIPALLSPGGRAFLMYYDADYEPFTHRQIKDKPGVTRPTFYQSSVGTLLFGKYRLLERARAAA